MSYLSIALTRLAEERQLKQSDIARESGISRSYISRVFSGESQDLSDQHFIAILKTFSAAPRIQAELIAARCQDARVGPGTDLVEIKIKDAAKAENGEIELSESVHLSKESEKAFAWLRSQCPVNPELEKHLVGYARMLGMK